jgi:hypothetical protein
VTTAAVTERTILAVVEPLVSGARERVWVTAPWVTNGAAGLLFDPLMARLRAGAALDVRIVYRLKGADDLTISDLESLDRLEAAGCQIRYSNRLHAKAVIVDGTDAVVSSSNLTSTAGYSLRSGSWQNEELGLHVHGEPELLADLAAEFEKIWGDAQALSDRTVGISLDEATAATFRVACMRPPVIGEFVTVGRPAKTLGQIVAVSSHNPTVPALEVASESLLGLRGGGGGRTSRVPSVETLFAHPSKAHSFLMAQTFVQASAAYHLADVAVLKTVDPDGSFSAPMTAVEAGEVVTDADPALLDALISGTQGQRVEIGALLANPDVRVTFDRDRLLRLHAAVLGMTGSGKSNAVKILIQRLLDPANGHPDLRIVVIDTHGEYDDPQLCPAALLRRIRVRFLPCVLDETWVRRTARTGRQTGDIIDEIAAALAALPSPSVDGLIELLETAAGDAGGTLKKRMDRLIDAVRTTPNLCLDVEAATVIEHADGSGSADLTHPGLFVLDLRATYDFYERARQAGAVARHLLHFAKRTAGAHAAVLVVDEAQNFVPEQQTGRLSAARASFEPMFEIASEGRKFNCGLFIASQRPARINKDVLSQCNTQIVFRMVNVEDLDAVRECFEGASAQLLAALPTFDTGTAYTGGVALATGTVVRFPESGATPEIAP